jgi:hypothetical protein
MTGLTADLRRAVTGGAWSTRWKPERYQLLRRSLVETIDGALVAVPPGYVEVDSGVFIMSKERVRLRLAEGQIERLIEDGDLRRL